MVVAADDDPQLAQEKLVLQGDNLSDQQRVELEELLAKFSCLFSDKPGVTDCVTHEVNTGSAPPTRSPPYQLAEAWKSQVKQEIEDLVKAGILVSSKSQWSNPIVPVRKPDGSVRLCADYRKLNKVTLPDPYCMPLIEELLNVVGQASYLSKLDLSKGFYQVPLSDAAREKSAIITPFGKFEYTRMPFGMRNAPASFQRLMDSVLNDCQDFSRAYIDDVLIYSRSWQEHLFHISSVLVKIKEAGLTVKKSKCSWGKSQIEYLGHRIGKGVLEIPQARVSALLEYRRPVTQKDVRSFLGMVGYYRRFIPNLAQIAKPLHDATRKSAPRLVDWTKEREEAFHLIRVSLANLCTLCIPSSCDSFVLHCDASYQGVGAVLNVCRDGMELPVAFYSRQLRGPEQRYSATEIECLAVVSAVRHFEVYLAGRQFKVHTDHQALTALLSSRVLNRRLTRWSLYLQEFNMDIAYRPGKQNGNADGMSRQAWPTLGQHTTNVRKLTKERVLPKEGGDVGTRPT